MSRDLRLVAYIMICMAVSCASDKDRPRVPELKYNPPQVSDAEYGPVPEEFQLQDRQKTGADDAIASVRRRQESAPKEFVVDLSTMAPKSGNGTKVSINVANAPVGALLRALSGAAGVNCVVHPDVNGKRSSDLSLMDVNWLEALESILDSNGLVATIRGKDIFAEGEPAIGKNDVIMIDTYANFAKKTKRVMAQAQNSTRIARQKRELRQETTYAMRVGDLTDLATRSYRFKYADPVEAMRYLKALYHSTGKGGDANPTTGGTKTNPDPPSPTGDSTGDISFHGSSRWPGVKFALYQAENLVTVTAPTRLMGKIMESIETIDVRPKQVYIEARIVEIQRNSVKELGVQWGGWMTGATGQTFPNTIGIYGAGTGFGDAPIVSLPPASAVDQETGATLNNLTGGVLGITLGGVSGSQLLQARLFALEQAGVSKTLSNPKILALNGDVATIKSGKEIPYQSSSANLGTTVRFREAVISLTVRALIMKDDKIRLKIRANKNEVDPNLSVQGAPAIKKKELSTSVVVENGGSAVLGGMYERADGDFQNRIPWFHKIPGLGWLFKNDREIDNNLELLVFITPTIVNQDRAR